MPTHNPAMTVAVEFFNWWFDDERTGKRCLTEFKLSREHAALAFAHCEPALQTRELRHLPRPDTAAPTDRRETD